MNELVSIIMPSYNTALYIEKAIQSVLAQTYENWELIIVDDCSTDNSLKIVEEYKKDNRIRVFRLSQRSGAAICRNIALCKAEGRWIAFLDSDDIWASEKLEKQIDFMKNNHYFFSYTCYEEIDEFGNGKGVFVSGPRKVTKKGMYRYCWPGCLTVMYDKNYIGLVQINNIQKNNDYAMWLKICKIADCYLLEEKLSFYRRGRSGSISTQKLTTLLKWHYRLFRDCEKCGIILSVVYTIRNILFGIYKKMQYVKKL